MENRTNIMVKEHSIASFFSDLKSLTKGIVLYANVLPVIAGFWLAVYFSNGTFHDYWDTFILTALGSTLIIAGALILNNWYEVDLDREMIRTENRPTVTGHFSIKMVLAMGISATVLGLLIMMLTTVEATVYAFLGWFAYVVLYTFWTKRKYTLNTVVGSVSGAFTPLIGWAAVDSAYHVVPITLFAILFIWQIPHTFAIAVRRLEDYKAAGVPMLPVVYGVNMTKRQTLVYIICLLPTPFFLLSLGLPFAILMTVLNVIWCAIGLTGLFQKDDLKWANTNFYYSLAYLTILFFSMIIFTMPFLN